MCIRDRDNDDHVSILHRYGDMGLQRFWGHEFDFLGSRDRWTRHMWFPIVGPLEPCIYLASLRRYLVPKDNGEMIKHGGPHLIEEIHQLCNKAWETNIAPTEWKKVSSSSAT